MDVAQNVGEECDDALEEEVEKEEAASAADEAVEDEGDLARRRAWRRHPETCNDNNDIDKLVLSHNVASSGRADSRKYRG